jgi:dihydrofolate reductase
MKRFKDLTTGHTVIMGRKTFESIGRALPNRKNIIITRQPNFRAEGCVVAASLEDAIKNNAANDKEIFIIGGGEIYRQALPITDRIYATIIEHEFQGDTYFPQIDTNVWKEISRVKGIKDEKNQYDYYFVTFERQTK